MPSDGYADTDSVRAVFLRDFHHRPLKKGHIRLFRALKDDLPNDRFVIKDFPLHPVTKSETPLFTAISYAWGSQQATEEIYLRGLSDAHHHVYSVTPHLKACLEAVAALYARTWYWVDAICISQDDSTEKAEQVTQIQDIFQSASRVLAWLGPTADSSDVVMDGLKNLATSIRPVAPFDGSKSITKMLSILPELQRQIPPKDAVFWKALTCFSRRDWFGRLWIIQEAVLARRLTLVCGRKRLEWQEYLSIHQFNSLFANSLLASYSQMKDYSVKQNPLHPVAFPPSVENIHLISKGLNQPDFPHVLLFGCLFNTITKQKCTEQLDRIYAILGISGHDLKSNVEVNYSKARQRHYWITYLTFFRAFISHATRKYDGVDCVQMMLRYTTTTNRHPDLPSWCPDPSGQRSYYRISQFTNDRIALRIDSEKASANEISLVPHSDDLEVEGYFIGDATDCLWLGWLSRLAECWPDQPSEEVRHKASQSLDQFVVICRRNGIGVTDMLAHLMPEHAADANMGRTRLRANFDACLHWLKRRDPGSRGVAWLPFLQCFDRRRRDYMVFEVHSYATGKYYMGVGDHDLAQGDSVYAFMGMESSFLLRPSQEDSSFKLVGVARVHNLNQVKISSRDVELVRIS